MAVVSRRFLLAGGAGAAVGFGGSTAVSAQQAVAPVFDAGCIDLGAAPYNIVAGQESEALKNTRAINQAIADHPAGVRLVLPAGAVYVQRDPLGTGIHRFAAISIAGSTRQRLELSGRGAGVTSVVMTGTQDSGLTQIIQVADGPSRITLCDFSIEHGPGVTNIDAGLQNHQIELNAVKADVTDVEIRDVFFGPCIGDGIRLAGGEGTTNPTFLRNTTIKHVILRLGKHPAAPAGCRSGISFQKGIRDLLLSDFFIVGPKNSCLDMEPTAVGGMDNITIADGTIDNTEGKTWVAASFDGFESNGNVTSFLTHSRMVNVRIKGGQLQVLSTRGCTIDNVVIEANRNDTADAVNSPLLVVYRENEDLAIRNVDIVRGPLCPPGPLVTVQHVVNSPKRVNIDGGTWTTRVGPGVELSYVDIRDTSGLRMHGTRIRIEDTLTGVRHGIRFRPGQRDMANISLDGVTIESPDGLTGGFVFGAIDRNLTNIVITGCTLTGAATNAVMFSAAGTFVVDRFPILQGNDFERCLTLFLTGQAAAGVVFPVIAGNRGSQCTLLGTVAPEGIVAARQGSQYIRQNGDAPELWWKASGTAGTGWKKLA